jgi:hypothetical protein
MSLGTRIRSFGAFWWDFVVGDDATIAAGVVVGLGATAGAVGAGWTAWWILPLFWVVAMIISLNRATK